MRMTKNIKEKLKFVIDHCGVIGLDLSDYILDLEQQIKFLKKRNSTVDYNKILLVLAMTFGTLFFLTLFFLI